MREKISFDRDWRFFCGDIETPFPNVKSKTYLGSKTERAIEGPAAYDVNYMDWNDVGPSEILTERWTRVDLPHDFMIREVPCEKNNNALGFLDYHGAWYRKHFKVDASDRGKRLVLYFEGIATHAVIWLNGCLLCRNFASSLSFEVDITDYVDFTRENRLAVYVDARQFEGWWYQGGGIYRHVWLIKTDPVSLDLWGVYAPAEKIDEKTWKVDFETTVLNLSDEDAEVYTVSRIKDNEGNVAAEVRSDALLIEERSKGVLRYTAKVDTPKIWDIDDPNLYTVETDVYRGGVLCDSDTTRIGFRTFEATPDKGFFLNGRRVEIKGVCAHQDFGLTGKAVPDNIYRYKIKMIKEMGANGYRTSHYAHSEQTMDALDEGGFIVMDECRFFESTEEGIRQLEMLVKRDRNRPSVFFWSLGNEEPYHVTEQGAKIGTTMRAIVKKLDRTRPVTTAISNTPNVAKVCSSLDLIGINYNLNLYDEVHEKNPEIPIFSSECCATGSTRSWYYDASPKHGYLPAYDRDTNSWFMGRENTWKFITSRPWIMGSYQWIAFEHRGEAAWPRICSQSGAIDLFMQKKDAFWQNKSHWTDEPMVHLLPHWNFEGREGDEIKVWAYTNCDELELFLNGRSLGRKQIEKYGHGEWFVPYEPGKLEVNAYNGGKLAAHDEKETTGRPAALRLRLENGGDVHANGDDIALYTCYCVDSEGREVPDAAPFVRFNCNMPNEIVGTGSDVSDHVPPYCPDRKMFMGRITVGVRMKSEELRLCASSDNLVTSYVKIEFKK